MLSTRFKMKQSVPSFILFFGITCGSVALKAIIFNV